MPKTPQVGRVYIFEDPQWTITLFADRSLTTKQNKPGLQEELFDYNDACDFLSEYNGYLYDAPLKCPIRRLAEQINYPFCLIEDWIDDAAINRKIAVHNARLTE